MGAKPKNSIKMYTFLSGFALLLILFVGHAFADCSVTDCTDMDGDNYTTNTTCNTDDTCPSCICGDCNDTNSQTYPSAGEICDEQDNDCDSIIENDEKDLDYDGFMECNGDCNDTNPDTYPDATEICDGQDNDCDGIIDNDPSCTGIPEFPSILAPILIILSTTLLRLKHAF